MHNVAQRVSWVLCLWDININICNNNYVTLFVCFLLFWQKQNTIITTRHPFVLAQWSCFHVLSTARQRYGRHDIDFGENADFWKRPPKCKRLKSKPILIVFAWTDENSNGHLTRNHPKDGAFRVYMTSFGSSHMGCGFSFKLKRKHLNWTYIREDKTLSYQPDVFNFILFSKTDGSRASHFTLWDPLIGAGKLTIPMTLRIQTCV